MRTVCFCNAWLRITHSAVGLRALGRILTFMARRVTGCLRGVCRGRQKACPCRYMAGRGRVRGEGKKDRKEEGKGGLSNLGGGEKN